ncbi:MAG TPA: hypothetical protein VGO34_15155 [Alphaproteobacteria bacterium]|jgi:TolB-like protein
MPGLIKLHDAGAQPETIAADIFEQESAAAIENEELKTQIRAATLRIISSEEFLRSERLRRFLQFIVDELLAGRGHQIKAYTIALAVCDRDDQFDPGVDPIVRIEAGRLRRALQHYYLTDGSGDRFRIDVPKGGYRPVISELVPAVPSVADEPPPLPTAAASRLSRVMKSQMAWLVAGLAVVAFGAASVLLGQRFDERELDVAATASTKAVEAAPQAPTVILRPLRPLSSGSDLQFFALGVTEDLVSYLSQNTRLNVRYQPETPSGGAKGEVAKPGDISISGSVRQAGNAIRIFIYLTQGADDRMLASQNFDRLLTPDSNIDVQDDLARAIVSYIEFSDVLKQRSYCASCRNPNPANGGQLAQHKVVAGVHCDIPSSLAC